MARKRIKFSITNLILIFVSLILFIITVTQISAKNDLIVELESKEMELKLEKEHKKLYDITTEFIKDSSKGEHYQYLTGKAKKSFENQLEQSGKEPHDHYHGETLVDSIDINNIYAVKTDKEYGESFSIYKVTYGNSTEYDTPTNMQQILTFTLQAKFQKVDGEYKVYSYKIDLLKDSLDEYIQEVGDKDDSNKEE